MATVYRIRKPLSVYEDDNFAGRVKLAASYISQRRSTNRTFDTCFEMNDGDAVCLALLRRVRKNPNTKLAQNIWKYLCRESVEPLEAKYQGVCPVALAKQLRSD